MEFEVGDRVFNDRFGDGELIEIYDRVHYPFLVLFDRSGFKIAVGELIYIEMKPTLEERVLKIEEFIRGLG